MIQQFPLGEQPGNVVVITACGNGNSCALWCQGFCLFHYLDALPSHALSSLVPCTIHHILLMLALRDKQFRRTKRAACVNSAKLQTFNQDKLRNNNINNGIQNNKRVIIVKPYSGGQEHHKTNYQCLTADGLGVASKTGKVYEHQRVCVEKKKKTGRVADSKQRRIYSSPESLLQQCVWSDRKSK